MNILFLTIGHIESLDDYGIYTDLLRCFRNHVHEIYVITPYEKRFNKETVLIDENHSHILHVKTGNVTKSSNLIEKGLAQLSLEEIYIKAIKEFFFDVKFDLVMYSTPPITFYRAINYVKRRDGARSYLLLKDIFPQNAVDLGMITISGPKGIIYKYFRLKEKRLYAISDRIGCMSHANVKYVLDHNPEVNPATVEVCPNAIEVIDKSVDEETKITIRKTYGIPLDKTVFVYGGNLGKPQGIPFIIECLKAQHIEKAFFLIVGDGTEYEKIESFVNEEQPSNVKIMRRLPKEDYDKMVAACDVGLLFLDYRFTIPNFPSRLLSYMQAKLPVLASTDTNTDVGQVIEEGNFGWWIKSNSPNQFVSLVSAISKESKKELENIGNCSYQYLHEHYTTEIAYSLIVKD